MPICININPPAICCCRGCCWVSVSGDYGGLWDENILKVARSAEFPDMDGYYFFLLLMLTLAFVTGAIQFHLLLPVPCRRGICSPRFG